MQEGTDIMTLPASIVDTHVHLWPAGRWRMSWIDQYPLLQQHYVLETYGQHTRDLPVDAFVFMECGVEPQYAFLETCWAAKLAVQDKRLQGIVATAPLEFGSLVQTYLEALLELGPVIKGVRRNLEGEQRSDFCLQPDFIKGVHLATAAGLSVDLCLRSWQLPVVTELVRSCPQTQFMLDHAGKPPIRSRSLDSWRQQIRTLATLPNVFCKVSGLVTEADPIHWSQNELAPLIEEVWDAFGEDRVVFAGDWPVLLLASSYQRWVEIVQETLITLPAKAQEKFWNSNAKRFYRLSEQRL
jgi:L-fuconolactonase